MSRNAYYKGVLTAQRALRGEFPAKPSNLTEEEAAYWEQGHSDVFKFHAVDPSSIRKPTIKPLSKSEIDEDDTTTQTDDLLDIMSAFLD